MCDVVYLPAPDYIEVESIAELESTFGRPVNEYHSAPEWITETYDKDVCLCNVDLERYLTDCGAKYEWANDYPGDLQIVEMPKATQI